MLKLDEDTTKNAVKRDFEKKCRVSARSRDEFAVRCANNHDHIVRFEERADGLYGECFLEGTGEACPSDLGKHVCYHITAALPLYLALKAGSIGRTVEADLDGQVETAIRFDGPMTETTPARTRASSAPSPVVGGMTGRVERRPIYMDIKVRMIGGRRIEKCRGIQI